MKSAHASGTVGHRFSRARVHPLWWLAIGAISLRMLLFLGRGDYVAFDEGWYLLLGRNLIGGEGFTLSGLNHIALSPLFPILAGAMDVLTGNIVWAGRLVAAVTGGLLVVPCWFVFRRIGGRHTAMIACVLIAVIPSLAPFVVPYWIGWDLWVGAEPLLHLLVFTGIALSLRAFERSRVTDWGLAGIIFGVAYLARPEAVITFGLVAIALACAFLLHPRATRAVAGVVFVLGFAAAAAPYWIYLHDVSGRWTITGRDVPVMPRMPSPGREAGSDAARPVEDMLWRDDDEYARRLYGLDASGERLADGYWGVSANTETRSQSAAQRDVQPAASDAPASSASPDARPGAPSGEAPAPRPGVAALFGSALRVIVPPYLWPLALIGVLARRRGSVRQELLTAFAIAGTAVVIAIVVAVDPRTQLLIVPLAVFYVARGIRVLGVFVEKRLRRHGGLRRGFVTAGLAVLVVAALTGTDLRRLYMSLQYGSPHHLVGAANRRVGEALRHGVPADEPVMSWHPAVALYARRDWRVLPYATFDKVVRYANAITCEYLVLSAYYPSPLQLEQLPREYLVLYVPPASAVGAQWRLELAPDPGPYVYAELTRRDP